jgi:hypothetical protein
MVHGFDGLSDEILQIDGGHWNILNVSANLSVPYSMLQLSFDHQNQKWISAREMLNYTYFLLEEHNGNWIVHDSASSGGVLPTGQAFSVMIATDDGRMIVRDLSQNLYQYYNGVWSMLNYMNNAANNTSFVSDADGNLWWVERSYDGVNFNYQLNRYNGASLSSFPFPQTGSYMLKPVIAKDGNIWVHGPQNTLYEFDGTNFINHNYPMTTASPQAMILKEDQIFLALYQEGIYHFDGSSWNHIHKDNSPMSSNHIMSLLLNEYGDLWMDFAYNDVVDVWHTNLNVVARTEEIQPHSIQVYPNPVNDRLVVKHSLENAKMELFDMQGRLIFEKPAIQSVEQLNLKNLHAANYLLRISNKVTSECKIVMKK